MAIDFEVATGSVTGRDHTHALRNNQDALAVLSDENVLVAVVADGCSSGRFSEVGAHLGARLLAHDLLAVCSAEQGILPALERIRQNMLAQLRLLAKAMGGRLSEVVNDYFLFTTVAAIITPTETIVVSIGDGLFATNEQIDRLGPFPGNAPPYLAYAITGSSLNQSPQAFQFVVNTVMSTRELETLLIGTDGVADLVAVQDRLLPGKAEPVGPLSQFWTEDRFYKNSFILGRRLNLINPSQPHIRVADDAVERHEGLLPDDTTLVVMRRRKGA